MSTDHGDVLVGPMPRWMLRAKCRTADPALFFPISDRDTAAWAAAKRFCRGDESFPACPVRSECAEHGLDIPHGVFGGLTPRERSAIRRRRARRP